LGEGQGEGRSFTLPAYKVEVKNINSFSFVEKAIEYEIKRHTELLERGETPTQETRGWDEDKNITISQRSKEEAADYRYFPEPDIPPFIWTNEYLDELRSQIPELPNEKRMRFIKEFGLSGYNAELLVRTVELAAYFEEAVRVGKDHKMEPKTIANTLLNKKVDIEKILPAELIKDLRSAQVTEELPIQQLHEVLTSIISQNEKAVADYKAGKTTVIMFLLGMAMRELKGKAKADTVKMELEKLLS
jgi:aspartyl-tRNA(Asn)/glutamyl-tRNA(Gln) amidotransferase subunit B